MKRIVCIILMLFMLTIQIGSYAALDYTLPEKMTKQLDFGSGLKGNFTIHGEGNDPFLSVLLPFQDAEMQFRGLRSGEKSHYYIYQDGENEEQTGLTELYNDGKSYYFRSDMLPNDVFRFPGAEELADLLSKPQGGNPSLASALVRWARLSKEEKESLLSPVVSNLSNLLEIWLAGFAEISSVRTLENGISVIDSSFVIPMSEVRKEIISLLEAVIRSEEGKKLLDALLNSSQKQIFANENLDYYYEEALQALDNDYDLIYSRTITVFGETISSSLELPLAGQVSGFQSLLVETSDGLNSYTLRSEDRLLTLLVADSIDWNQINGFSAWICTRPNPAAENPDTNRYHAYRLDVQFESESSTDEESRDHERNHWIFTLQGDTTRLPSGESRENYPDEPPVSLDLMLHYFSRYSQSSPTTLEISAVFSKENMKLSAQGQFKTASPWVFSPFSIENAKDFFGLNVAEMELKFAEFLATSGEKLIQTPSAETKEEPDTVPEETEKPAQNDSDLNQAEETSDTDQPSEAEGVAD